jgi:hypothetical protein
LKKAAAWGDSYHYGVVVAEDIQTSDAFLVLPAVAGPHFDVLLE